MYSESEERSRKRLKLSNEDGRPTNHSLTKSISPPPRREPEARTPRHIKSPFQLTWIRDLPATSNVDAVSLRDILGDPLIAECWDFNYLHDVDFLMEQFDEDVRALVQVNIVHGFWKREDRARLAMQVCSIEVPR